MTVTLLAEHSHLPSIISMVYVSICALALASHAKCMFTDPGAIPTSAVPPLELQQLVSVHAMCSHCETYKRECSVSMIVVAILVEVLV